MDTEYYPGCLACELLIVNYSLLIGKKIPCSGYFLLIINCLYLMQTN